MNNSIKYCIGLRTAHDYNIIIDIKCPIQPVTHRLAASSSRLAQYTKLISTDLLTSRKQ